MTDIFDNTSLDTQVFGDELDFKTLENILETLDHVEAKKISRQNFNNLKGDFLVENGKYKKGEQKYILYLPKDLKIYELPAIIRRINRITFGKENPLYASTRELKIKIAIIYKKLLNQLKNNKDNKALKEALKKYYLLYQNLLPKEKKDEANNLNKISYLEKIIKQGDKDKYEEYQEKITKIKTQESLNKLKEGIGKIDKVLGQEIKNHLYESLFEKSINMLRLGMETLTQAELQAKIKDLEEKGFKKEEKNGEIYYIKGYEEVVIENDIKNFDEKERLLREKIGIKKFKQELEQARIEGNQEKINELEIEASNKIIETLYDTYPYYSTKENNGYQANKIKEFKEVYCVGFSLLGHTFLSELKIKHNGLDIARHSALEVLIGGKKYYFDATADKIIHEYDYSEKDKVGDYYKLPFNKKLFFKPGNPEKILLSQVLNNKGSLLLNLLKYEEAREMYNIAIELNSKDVLTYNNKGFSLYNLEKYEEAREMYNIAIELNPKYALGYNNKGHLLIKQGISRLGKLYQYTSNKLNGNSSWFEILYRTEKQEIDKFIKKENYEGLRKYLLDLEKEED